MLVVGEKRQLKASGLIFYVTEVASSASYFTLVQTDVKIRFRFDRKSSSWISIDDVEKESVALDENSKIDETDPCSVLDLHPSC